MDMDDASDIRAESGGYEQGIGKVDEGESEAAVNIETGASVGSRCCIFIML